jgi:capsule polysaccharide export protein KpsE/RkpR
MTLLVNDRMPISEPAQPLWVHRSWILWRSRRLLARVVAISLVLSLIIAFTIPKRYKAAARVMPPEQQGLSAMMLAALAGRGGGGLGALGALAGDLYGGHSSAALFTGLLRSGTISSHVIDRFDLMRIYHKRYHIDAAKRLARNTVIKEDKKSGILTIEVQDTDPNRAREIAQAYLDELNQLVTRTTTSAAHRERIFIEGRLASVQRELERAQEDLSEFSSRNTTVDLKEQTRALVDVGARLQGELLVQQSSLQSLKQIYGDSNLRVRESEARIATLQRELTQMAGSSAPGTAGDGQSATDTIDLYPRLRQLPRLAVPYADLYRRVKVQETIYELLTQQYELARIEEAKDIPVVSVIDAPSVPEKKSFPPRLLVTLALTLLSTAVAALVILARAAWAQRDASDPVKELGTAIFTVIQTWSRRLPALCGKATS